MPKRNPKKFNSFLDKVLEKHLPLCKHYEYSGDRHCSCGVEKARKELEELREKVNNMAKKKQTIHASQPRLLDVVPSNPIAKGKSVESLLNSRNQKEELEKL